MEQDDIKQDKKLIKRAFGMHDKQEHKGKHTDLSKLKKGGLAMKKHHKLKEGSAAEERGESKAFEAKEDESAEMMKKGGKVKKYAAGGSIEKTKAGKSTPSYKSMGSMNMKKGGSVAEKRMEPSTMSEDVEKGSNKLRKFGEAKVQKREATRGKNLGDSGPTVGETTGGMKKGGKVKKYARGGGIESKGKTKGRFC
jgi:hypothetical protein